MRRRTADPIRVLLVDDQALLRTAFRIIFDETDDILVVGEASNGEEAVAQAHRSQPDVVLTDIRMPGMDGILAGTPARPDSVQRLTPLTAREREVLTLIARGRSNAEIAQDLHLSMGTVSTHIGRIFAQLDLRDRVQAVILAYECGLVPPKPGAGG